MLSKTFLILRRIQRDIVINVKTFSCKVPVILVTFLKNLNFLGKFSKNSPIPNGIKIRPVGVEFFHAYELTDGHEVTSRCSQFLRTRVKVKLHRVHKHSRQQKIVSGEFL